MYSGDFSLSKYIMPDNVFVIPMVITTISIRKKVIVYIYNYTYDTMHLQGKVDFKVRHNNELLHL
jgi:hypothetical protein